jgi:hypothetical protein
LKKKVMSGKQKSDGQRCPSDFSSFPFVSEIIAGKRVIYQIS